MSISFSPSVACAATNAILITCSPAGQYSEEIVQAAWEVRNRFNEFAWLFKEYRNHEEGTDLLRVRILHRSVVLAVRELEKLLGLNFLHEDLSFTNR